MPYSFKTNINCEMIKKILVWCIYIQIFSVWWHDDDEHHIKIHFLLESVRYDCHISDMINNDDDDDDDDDEITSLNAYISSRVACLHLIGLSLLTSIRRWGKIRDTSSFMMIRIRLTLPFKKGGNSHFTSITCQCLFCKSRPSIMYS